MKKNRLNFTPKPKQSKIDQLCIDCNSVMTESEVFYSLRCTNCQLKQNENDKEKKPV